MLSMIFCAKSLTQAVQAGHARITTGDLERATTWFDYFDPPNPTRSPSATADADRRGAGAHAAGRVQRNATVCRRRRSAVIAAPHERADDDGRGGPEPAVVGTFPYQLPTVTVACKGRSRDDGPT